MFQNFVLYSYCQFGFLESKFENSGFLKKRLSQISLFGLDSELGFLLNSFEKALFR